MSIVRKKASDIDTSKLLRELAARPLPSEAEIEAMAAEDGDAWTDEDFVRAVIVSPPPTAVQVRAARVRLGMDEGQFALQFGLTVEDLRRFDRDGVPPGAVGTLLLLVVKNPEAVMGILDPGRLARTGAAPSIETAAA